MPYLSPPTLTRSEVESLLQTTARHPRDHLTIALALGTGLRLGEIVGLDVGDVYLPEGTPRTRVRLRAEIAKGGPPDLELLARRVGAGSRCLPAPLAVV
jgi:integrase